jgi:hypothetical protein
VNLRIGKRSFWAERRKVTSFQLRVAKIWNSSDPVRSEVPRKPVFLYKHFNIFGEKIIGSRRPRAVDRTAMRLGGNGMGGKIFLPFLHKCGDLEMTLIAVLRFLFLNKGIMVTS